MTWDEMKNKISLALKDPILQQGFEIICKELNQERKLNAEIKARFVKCNTCTDEMKSKCLMFSENLCEGERCEELVDLMSLISKSELEKENAELKEKLGIYQKGMFDEIEKRDINLTKAKEIIKKLLHSLKNEGSDYTFALESTHPVLAEAEQFLSEVEK